MSIIRDAAADQGKGKAIAIGLSDVTTLQISSLALLCGRTLKGSIFGGLRTKTDLPLLIEKCKNKVNSPHKYLQLYKAAFINS